jgi:hypothetical protein
MIIPLFEASQLPFIRKILDKEGIEYTKVKTLAGGGNGTAYSLGNGKVLKITGDDNEYKVAQALQSGEYKHFPKIYNTFECSDGYCIVRDMADRGKKSDGMHAIDYDLENMDSLYRKVVGKGYLAMEICANIMNGKDYQFDHKAIFTLDELEQNLLNNQPISVRDKGRGIDKLQTSLTPFISQFIELAKECITLPFDYDGPDIFEPDNLGFINGVLVAFDW